MQRSMRGVVRIFIDELLNEKGTRLKVQGTRYKETEEIKAQPHFFSLYLGPSLFF
jgi:hypothetical protein